MHRPWLPGLVFERKEVRGFEHARRFIGSEAVLRQRFREGRMGVGFGMGEDGGPPCAYFLGGLGACALARRCESLFARRFGPIPEQGRRLARAEKVGRRGPR